MREALAEISRLCRGVLGNGSWVPPENFHLTVRFLGEVPKERLPELLEVGRKAAEETKSFALSFEILGGFPETKAARVLWVGPKVESLSLRSFVGGWRGLCAPWAFPRRRRSPFLT